MTMNGFPAYEGTREDWANKILGFFAPRLAELGIVMPPERSVRVGVTPLSRTTLGRCHSSNQSATGSVNFIALCTKQADARELVHTLVHEYLHACDDCASGHRHRWKRWADKLGISARGHERNALLDQLINAALATVGEPVQHVASKGRPPARKSQVRVVCPTCRRHAHVPAKAHAEGFTVSCYACIEIMLDPEESP